MNGPRHDPRGERAGGVLRRAPRPVVGVVGLALLGLLSGLPGCGIGINASSAGLAAPAIEDAAVPVDAAVVSSKDAAVEITVPVVPVDGGGSDVLAANGRSPLCGLSAAGSGSVVSCDPDGKACVPAPTAAVDAGPANPYDAGAGASTYGCHVTATHPEAGATLSVAVCSASGEGTAESPCYASANCAAGFECVVDTAKAHADGAASGGGVCRHYCCDDTCDGQDSFCHIESTVNGAVSVPVCVMHNAPAAVDAGTACELLNDETCSAGLTCQVVNQFTGEVACVAPGSATAGQSCETSNCAEGLSCILGYFPARECAQLCYLQNDNCPSGETCTASSAIAGASAQIGTCSQ